MQVQFRGRLAGGPQVLCPWLQLSRLKGTMRQPPALVGHLGHGLGGRLVLALTIGHSPFESARSTAPRTLLHSSFLVFLDQTVLIKRQKASSDWVCDKYARTPSAVYMGYGRPQECISEGVTRVISVTRPPTTTGVLDLQHNISCASFQNLDQATPGNDSTAPLLRARERPKPGQFGREG